MPVLLIRSSLEKFFKKNFRDDSSFCFGFAKVLAFAFIFTLITTAESSAETWDCGEIANTVSCSLDENGVFTISGTGKMKDYQRAKSNTNTTGWLDNRPWGSIEIANSEFTNIQTVVVGKGVTYIGTNAFEGFSCIKELKGMDDVEEIGGDAFYGADLDNVNMPKVKIVGDHAFLSNKNLKNINMPNVEVFYGHSFTGVPIGSYSGDCLQYKNGNCVRNDKWRCLSGYLLKENICIDSADGCGAGYKDMGGWCNRLRYTPAEAAQVLRDDNTNSVVITFKK